MEKSALKKIRDNMPPFINWMLAPFIRSMLVNNKIFKDTYAELVSREKLSRTEIEKNQFIRLKEILIYAGRHVPYYRNLFNEIDFDPLKFQSADELKRIPFLTREIINNNFSKLISEEKVKNGFYTATTGGSSGTPLKILLDYDSIYVENAYIYYFRRKLGYKNSDKIVTLRGNDIGNSFWKSNPLHNEVIFSPMKLSPRTINIYYKKINQLRPVFLNGYLSALWNLAKLMKDSNLEFDHPIKGIFLISENIDVSQREYIENFFKAPSSTFYGHSERCIIANETEKNKYSFDPYYGFTENIPIEGDRFAIVGTGLLNKSMPLIRYKTDDESFKVSDLFGIDGKRISNVGLIGYNDEFLPGSAFDLEDEIFKNIINYQFIQNRKGVAELNIVVNSKFSEVEFQLISNEIKGKLKGIIDIKISVVENLKLSPRGKFQQYHINIHS